MCGLCRDIVVDILLDSYRVLQWVSGTNPPPPKSEISEPSTHAVAFFLISAFYSFYCQGRTLLIYTLTTLSSAIAGSYLPFQKWFNQRKNKGWRIAFFVGICFTALAPLTHLAIEHGLGPMFKFALPILPSIVSYVAGLMFYAFHFPEAKYPGKFDYLGHSHQVSLGTLFVYLLSLSFPSCSYPLLVIQRS